MRALARISPPMLAVAVALWLLAFDNTVFWQIVWTSRDDSSVRGIASVAALAIVVWMGLALSIRLLCWKSLSKPIAIGLLLIGAVASHFIDRFGVLVEKGAIRNVLQTDWNEVVDLLTLQMMLDISLRGVLPAFLIVRIAVDPGSLARAFKGIACQAALLCGFAACTVAMFYGDYASTIRNHRELRHVLTPVNVFKGIYGMWKDRAQSEIGLVEVGGDAQRIGSSQRPLVVVLVVGETARAANFSLGGYPRVTNAALVGKEVVFFENVIACGTDTATSLPCMFSDLGSGRFTVSEAAQRENVLDTLGRTGVNVRWWDNNSGCKGVCQRIPTQDLSVASDPKLCHDRECLDGILIEGLREGLAREGGDSLFVLHMKGSHGPAYYRRSPISARRFQPTCDTNSIQRCSVDDLRNTYDNSIVYTSEVLAEMIDMLNAQADRVDSVLIYISDHGESLGEGNIYLHGLPKMLAPSEQTRVPMILWLSPGASQRLSVSRDELQSAAKVEYTHDNLAPTLLALFSVSTEAYRTELDILTIARSLSSLRSLIGIAR